MRRRCRWIHGERGCWGHKGMVHCSVVLLGESEHQGRAVTLDAHEGHMVGLPVTAFLTALPEPQFPSTHPPACLPPLPPQHAGRAGREVPRICQGAALQGAGVPGERRLGSAAGLLGCRAPGPMLLALPSFLLAAVTLGCCELGDSRLAFVRLCTSQPSPTRFSHHPSTPPTPQPHNLAQSSPHTAVEALISINNQLRQPDAAVGVLNVAQKELHMDLKESWWVGAGLGDWLEGLKRGRGWLVPRLSASGPPRHA